MEPDREANMGKHTTRQGVKRRKPLFIGMFVLVFAVIGLLVRHETRPPTFQGKTAKEWFSEIGKNGVVAYEGDPAVQALVAMGEPAVSYLMQEFLMEQPARVPKCVWFVLEKMPDRVNQYAYNHISRGPNYLRSFRASRVLKKLGPKAQIALPELIQAADSDAADGYIQSEALRLLGFVCEDTSYVLPFLVHRLGDDVVYSSSYSAALGLSALGPAGKAAVPQLLQILNDVDFHLGNKGPAIVVLISQNDFVDFALSVGCQILNGSSASERVRLVIFLGLLNQKGRPGIPLVLTALQDPKDNVREAATNALKHIDPAAAAKAGIQ